MQHGTTILLVDRHTIDDNKRLCIGIERIKALQEDGSTYAGSTVACNGIGIGPKLFLYFLFYINGIAVLQPVGSLIGTYIVLVVSIGRESLWIKAYIALLLTLGQTHAYGIIIGTGNVDSSGEDRNFEFERAIVSGEHTVTIDAIGMHNDTGQWMFVGSIEYTPLYDTGGILLLARYFGASLSRLLPLIEVVGLGIEMCWCCQQRQAQR